MRVLYILDEQGGGGSFYSMIEMISMLSNRHGVEPVILVSEGCNRYEELCGMGLEVVECPYGSFMQAKPSEPWKIPVKYLLYDAKYHFGRIFGPKFVEQAIDFNSIDLIHSNINRVDIGAQLAQRNNIPHVQHVREFGDLDFGCWSYVSNPGRHVSAGADELICISKAVRSYWVNAKCVNPNKTRVVYNGVNQSRFISKQKRYDDEVRFVMCGAISKTKGQMTVYEAFRSLPNNLRERSYLDFYGEMSPEAALINKRISKDGLSSRVRLLGRSSDIPQLLCRYDVGIVASRAEGFGRVTVEYLAAGLRVLASDSGANKELLTDEDGEIGEFFPVGDSSSLSKLMAGLIRKRSKNNDEMQRRIRRASAFTAELNADGIWRVYQEVLEAHYDKIDQGAEQ